MFVGGTLMFVDVIINYRYNHWCHTLLCGMQIAMLHRRLLNGSTRFWVISKLKLLVSNLCVHFNHLTYLTGQTNV